MSGRRGVVLVVDADPQTARAALAGLPPGEYRVHVWHERATEATLARLASTVTVPASGLTLGVLRLSEAGYLPVPHLNKHGEAYPPEPASAPGAYQGRRK